MYEHRRNLNSKYGPNSFEAKNAIIGLILDKQKAKETNDTLMNKKNLIKKEWDKNKQDIIVLAEQYNLFKGRIDFVRGILKEYYLRLLNQGTDIR